MAEISSWEPEMEKVDHNFPLPPSPRIAISGLIETDTDIEHSRLFLCYVTGRRADSAPLRL